MAEADNSNVETGYGISRASVFTQITYRFFSGDLFTSCFGLGFGSASQSSISVFCAPFYNVYGYLHYHLLTSAMLFIQMGYFGVILYISPIVWVFARLLLKRKSLFESGHEATSSFAFVICCLFTVNCMYNSTAHTYPAVLWSLVLCVGVFDIMTARGYEAELSKIGTGNE